MTEPDPSAGAAALDLDPLTEAGAAELRRRVAGATPRRIDRAELDGHVGLSSRELYELGVTVAPVGLRGVPSALGGRLLVVAAAVVGTLLVAVAASVLVDPLLGVLFGPEVRGDAADRSTGAAFGQIALCGLGGVLVLAAGRWGVRQVRAGIEERRRTTVQRATPAADDPEARATVAVVREPGMLRLSLLWVRGDVDDAARVEVRTIEEQRVPDDEPGRAEDAVARLSEVALRADAGRRVPWVGRRGDGASARAGVAPAEDGRSDHREDHPHDRREDHRGDRRNDHRDGRRADAGGRADRALVRAARAALPPVDPREAVGPGWAPEPLTEEGGAELAARLVRARPLLWNAGVLEALRVDPTDRRPHEPGSWPSPHARRKALRKGLPDGRRALIGWVGWLAFVVCIAAIGGADGADAPGTTRAIGYAALVVAVLVGGNVWWWRHRGPGRRLLRSVREAARVPGRGLERGVPGPGGRVLVLHGRRDDGRDRVELVHVRAVPGEERGRLQVRTLAWRELPPDAVEQAREVAQAFWVVADDAAFLTGRTERETGALRRINAALGRVAARRRDPAIAREPLVWVAVPLALCTVVALLAWAVVGRGGPGDLSVDLAVRLWPLAAAAVLWRAARRVHDPVEE